MSKVVCIFCRGEVIGNGCGCDERYSRWMKSLIEDINGIRLRTEDNIADFEIAEFEFEE